jgi:hypothetical protein
MQALQLLLLRRYSQNVLGPLTSRVLPELLLADGSRCSETAALMLLRELQAMTSAPQEPLSSSKLRLCGMGMPAGVTYVQQLQPAAAPVGLHDAQLRGSVMEYRKCSTFCAVVCCFVCRSLAGHPAA